MTTSQFWQLCSTHEALAERYPTGLIPYLVEHEPKTMRALADVQDAVCRDGMDDEQFGAALVRWQQAWESTFNRLRGQIPERDRAHRLRIPESAPKACVACETAKYGWCMEVPDHGAVNPEYIAVCPREVC